MGKLNRVKGDLLRLAEEGNFDFIVHGCNCFRKMKSGIAGQIARKYPIVAEADSLTLTTGPLRDKLGKWTSAKVISSSGNTFTVINAYTQYTYSRDKDVFEYDAFAKFLGEFSNYLEIFCLNPYKVEVIRGGLKSGTSEWVGSDKPAYETVRVGFPKIGCGLAGGDESRIVAMLEGFALVAPERCFVTLVDYQRG